MDQFSYRSGLLHCESLPVPDLAVKFGTPLYVYSRATLEDHYDKLAAAFAPLSPLICYSIKSCSNISICRVLGERGGGMDVVSGGELERARLAGVPMDKVVYAGVGKTQDEIRAALAARIGYFNIESEPEFEAISRLARETRTRSRAALRINPDVDPRTHAYTSTGKKESKFGVDIQRALAFFEKYGRDEFLTLDALHLHIGSPVYETRPYIDAITKTLGLIDDLERRGHTIAALDIGGGFAADYETDKSPRAADYAAAIVPLLRDHVARGLKIILEPGRTISANAGLLLTRVLYVKDGAAGKKFVICDAGMHTLIRPSLYGAFHFVWPVQVSPNFEPPRRGQTLDIPGLITCDVVGPICESGDFLAKDRKLPPVKAGDLIAIFAAGAYGMTMASTYNTQPRPAEVLVEVASARVIRRRETLDEILAPELAAR
jgi:diaminopimelate decarboxylase